MYTGNVPFIGKLHGDFEVSNLGRGKVTIRVKAKTASDILRAVKPHLMSKDVDLVWDPEKKHGFVLVGGFRAVGEFKRIETEEKQECRTQP